MLVALALVVRFIGNAAYRNEAIRRRPAASDTSFELAKQRVLKAQVADLKRFDYVWNLAKTKMNT